MAETDALSSFDFSKVIKGGLFLKFIADKPVVIRVLTTDPVVSNQEYQGSDGEVTLSTKFNFIVYNFTDDKAQILSASPSIAQKIGALHTDEDFGANIRKIDIKITPTGEKIKRRYDIQVLPKTNDLTDEQVKECRAINLDEKIENGQRMSFYKPEEKNGYDQAKEVRDALGVTEEDVNNEEPINLDDIPF